MNGDGGDAAPADRLDAAEAVFAGFTGAPEFSEQLVSQPSTEFPESVDIPAAMGARSEDGEPSAKRLKTELAPVADTANTVGAIGGFEAAAAAAAPSELLHQHLMQQQLQQQQRQAQIQLQAQQQQRQAQLQLQAQQQQRLQLLQAHQMQLNQQQGLQPAVMPGTTTGVIGDVQPNLNTQQLLAMANPNPALQLQAVPAPPQDLKFMIPAARAVAPPVQPKQEGSADEAAGETKASCLICRKDGELFTCQGGCGLRAHVGCIGEDAVFQSLVGQVCGSCYIMQQTRNSKENLTRGGGFTILVCKAISSLNLDTNTGMNFEKFGHLTSLRLMEMGEVAGYPIKPFAEKFVEPFLQRWLREKLVNVEKWQLTLREVFTLMIGLYSLKRACIAHEFHDKAIALVAARNFTVTDYLGWHPAIESPNVKCSSICAICGIRNPPELELCARCHRRLSFPSIYSKYTSSLLAAYYGDQVGIPIGASVVDVFVHANTVRAAYKGLAPLDTDGHTWENFLDQMRTIFALLDVMSNFGSLQLSAELFEPETRFIFSWPYVQQAMFATDFETVGKLLQCMKLFGREMVDKNIQLVNACERWLLGNQKPTGSWCRMGGSDVDQYKATVTCANALLTPVFRGHGPLTSECQRLLDKWAKNGKNVPSKLQTGDNSKLLACGAVAKPSARSSMKRLESLYKRQLVPEKGLNALEHLVTVRMSKFVSEQSVKDETADEEPTTPDKEAALAKPEDQATAQTKEETDNELPSAAGNDGDVKPEDDDALTHLSLNGELEIFDGLKFEDGDVIDLSHHLPVAAEEDDADGDENAEGDAAQPDDVDDEIGEDDMYDDDNDDNDDGQNASDEVPIPDDHTSEPSAGDDEAVAAPMAVEGTDL